MSCVPCEEVEKKGDVAYVRVDKANVGLIGCDEHVGKVLDMLDACRDMVKNFGLHLPEDPRRVVRIKGSL